MLVYSKVEGSATPPPPAPRVEKKMKGKKMEYKFF